MDSPNSPRILTKQGFYMQDVGDEHVISFDGKNQGLLSRWLAMASLGLLCSLFYLITALFLVSLYQIIWNRSGVALAILICVFASSYYPSQILWQQFIDLPLWKLWCEYFSFTCIVKRKGCFDPKGHYMFIEFPHGVFPLGFMLSATLVQHIMPGLRVEGALASILFHLPIIGHIAHWFGSRPATSKNINLLLDDASVGILVGGIAEIFCTSTTQEKIYLRKRKGFVKVALERGVPLVPIYYFGQTQLLQFVGGRLISRISRALRTSLILYYGRYFLPIPYQVPITMVVGEPIPVDRVAQPTEQQIDELHQRFMDEVVKLFDEYKGRVAGNWKDRKLEII
jgi:1-acyl-sn-glycerol-3-phosphate acyltransferase